MRVTVIIAFALALFSCKKEEVFDSQNDGESMKLLYSNVSSWEGKDAPLCKGGHSECGADYYFQFLVPQQKVKIDDVYINNKKYNPEISIIPGFDKDTVKMQMHFFEHSSCKQTHPKFLLKGMESQSLKVVYSFKDEVTRVFEQRVKVTHQKLQ